MAKKERLRRDIAGVGPEPRRTGLRPLSGMKDFRIAKGEPDIRGWAVRTLNGREVGKVDDLLVDADAGEVVMMDVEMRASERHLQLPMRFAQLDHEAKRVIVDSGDVETYSAMGEMPAGERDRDRYVDSEEARHDRLRAREDELAEHDLRMREQQAQVQRDVRSPDVMAQPDEVVVERRPVIEEVVIRRRVVDTDDHQ